MTLDIKSFKKSTDKLNNKTPFGEFVRLPLFKEDLSFINFIKDRLSSLLPEKDIVRLIKNSLCSSE